MKIKFLLFALFLAVQGLAQGILLIEFDPYDEYFINLDGKAYFTAKSSVLMYGISKGNHRIVITPKNDKDKRLDYTIKTNGEKDYFILQKRITGLKLVNRFAPAEEVIRNIMVKADSIFTKNEKEPVEENCNSYDHNEFGDIIGLYVSASNKSRYIDMVFKDKCITPNQFMKMIDRSLTTEEKFEAFTRLYPKLSIEIGPRNFSYLFERTEYFRDYLKYIKNYE